MIPLLSLYVLLRGDIRKVTYGNALAVYGQSGQMREADWLEPAAIDQRTLYQGNTILRGGQSPRVEWRHAYRRGAPSAKEITDQR